MTSITLPASTPSDTLDLTLSEHSELSTIKYRELTTFYLSAIRYWSCIEKPIYKLKSAYTIRYLKNCQQIYTREESQHRVTSPSIVLLLCQQILQTNHGSVSGIWILMVTTPSISYQKLEPKYSSLQIAILV